MGPGCSALIHKRRPGLAVLASSTCHASLACPHHVAVRSHGVSALALGADPSCGDQSLTPSLDRRADLVVPRSRPAKITLLFLLAAMPHVTSEHPLSMGVSVARTVATVLWIAPSVAASAGMHPEKAQKEREEQGEAGRAHFKAHHTCVGLRVHSVGSMEKRRACIEICKSSGACNASVQSTPHTPRRSRSREKTKRSSGPVGGEAKEKPLTEEYTGAVAHLPVTLVPNLALQQTTSSDRAGHSARTPPEMDTQRELALIAARTAGADVAAVARRIAADELKFQNGQLKDAYLKGLSAAFLSMRAWRTRAADPAVHSAPAFRLPPPPPPPPPPRRHVLKGVYGDPSLHLELATRAAEWDTLTPCELLSSATQWLRQEATQIVEECVAPKRRASAARPRAAGRRLRAKAPRARVHADLSHTLTHTGTHGWAAHGAAAHGATASSSGNWCEDGITPRRRALPWARDCGRKCEIPFCTRRVSEAKCTDAAVRRLVRFRCRAPRDLAPAVLAQMALDVYPRDGRALLFGRAGNGELNVITAVGMLLETRRVKSLSEIVRGHKKRQYELQKYVFSRPEYMQSLVANTSQLPETLLRAALEYTSALGAADFELHWDEQSQETLFMRCDLLRLARSPRIAAYSPPLAAALASLPRTFGRMIHYDARLTYWLDVLEALSRRRARLLVVTGFAESVRKQLPRLHLIHPSRNLSGLRIRVLAAPLLFPAPIGHSPTPAFPQRSNPNDEAYGAFLDELYSSGEWDSRLNEVAILGCGWFGMPLAHHARQANISAIYIGGLIQLLFGLTGRRYVDAPHANSSSNTGSLLATNALSGIHVNAHWMSPLASETPRNRLSLENGAYW